MIFAAGNTVYVFLDSAALNFFYLLNNIKLDAVIINDITVAIAHSDNLCAKGGSLFASVNSNVAATGNNYCLAFKRGACVFQHFLSEVAKTVTGSLSSYQRTAVHKSLAGEYAGELVTKTLVLTEHIADLSCANADITCGNVGICADMLCKLCHKGLAETHNFVIGLALGIKIGAALTAAHRQTGERVFEYLLKTEELDNGSVNRGVETDSSLIRSDSGIELNAVTAVNLNVALIIYPAYTENDKTLGFGNALQNTCFFVLGMSKENRFDS